MCFESLPIAFDEDGRASLVDAADFSVKGARPATVIAPSPNGAATPGGRIRDFSIDPVTRVAGALAFHAQLDLDAGTVTDSHTEAVLFRGYELILRGRNPLEAIDISSRACGVCGGVHSTCAAMALEMTFGAVPPPLAVAGRNIAEAAELVYDHCLHLFLLAGPDYSEMIVKKTNPKLWAKAETAPAPRAAIHKLKTIGEIMQAMNPLEGALYGEALGVTRTGREIVSLIYGKYPHPSAVVPAGLGTTIDEPMLKHCLDRMKKVFDFSKRVAAVWEDIVEFFYEADDRYREVGRRRANLVTTGMWDDPEAYDATYANANEWGEKRMATPGAIVDGKLRTTQLNQINLGIEEFVDHSFYEEWGDGAGIEADPSGSPISPFHPWNKLTVPRPEARNWKERYSWGTAPRWDREPMESGPLARNWVTAEAGFVNNDFIKSGGGELAITVPKDKQPEAAIEWRVPDVVNCLERNRARAIHVPYCVMVAYHSLLQAREMVRSGETAMSEPFEIKDGIGVGYWEGGRGILTHHCEIRDGKLANYQIITPSTWMASPRDPWGSVGPYEEAVVGTPLLEESGEDEMMGIDILRTIRSFDPCLPCTVHVHAGDSTLIRDATTCACGAEA